MNIPKELIKDIEENRTILFLGAGVSESLGHAPWGNLIDEMAKEIGYDKEVFRSMGNHLELAEFYRIRKKSITSIVKWMDKNWHNNNIKIEKSKVHEAIVKLNMPIIYTTNYDGWIEEAFKYYNVNYTKIVKVEDLVNIKEGVTQIIKFHGDLEFEDSIVLTESNYFKRLSFESALDIKLKSDILAKSILFIGYSLNDINIRYLLFKLNEIWKCSDDKKCRPKSYIFLLNKNSVQEEILKSRGVNTIIYDGYDKDNGIKNFLIELLKKVKF